MTENANSTESSTSGILVTCLYIVAGLSVAAGVLISVACFLQTPQENSDALEVWARAAEALMFGVVAACLLWSAAWMVRQREEATFSQRRMLHALSNLRRQNEGISGEMSSTVSAGDVSSAYPGDVMPQLLRQLSELNANVLLTEEQRQEKHRNMLLKMASDLSGEIESALMERRFDDAGDLVHRLEEVDPRHDRLGVFHEQVEVGQEEQVRELISGQVRRAGDLMSVSRFDEAVEVAQNLHRTYPQSREADELLSRVQREASTYHTEQRRRLFSIIQEHSQARHWKQALAGAHKLLETYADSEEAQKIRTMMPTFVDNARIQEVREYRDKIVDLMERHRYSEAVELARHVVDNYPETTAAEELRTQLPRWHELAYANKSNDE
jgi:tetratricopeptide (TPR) repeat protein